MNGHFKALFLANGIRKTIPSGTPGLTRCRHDRGVTTMRDLRARRRAAWRGGGFPSGKWIASLGMTVAWRPRWPCRDLIGTRLNVPLAGRNPARWSDRRPRRRDRLVESDANGFRKPSK